MSNIDERRVSIRFDERNSVYFCFYRPTEDSMVESIFSFDVQREKWSIETRENSEIFSKIVLDPTLSFEMQVEQIVRVFDEFFGSTKKIFFKSKRSVSMEKLHRKKMVSSFEAKRFSASASTLDKIDKEFLFEPKPPIIGELFLLVERRPTVFYDLFQRNQQNFYQQLAEKFITIFSGLFLCDAQLSVRFDFSSFKLYGQKTSNDVLRRFVNKDFLLKSL